MIMLDVVIACMLAVTSVYCWRLNRKIASFRNAKEEMDQVIRAFDSSIRQAYESISILKKAGTNENIQFVRDMKKIQFLANDLAFLVEKGEKVASNLEGTIRETSKPQARERAADSDELLLDRPVSIPPRRAAAAAPAPQRVRHEPTAEELQEVKDLVDTLARSYVTEQQPAVMRPAAAAAPRPVAQSQPQPQPQPQPAVRPVVAAAPSRSAQPEAVKENKVRAIEKMLNHMNARGTEQMATMPSIPPRDLIRKASPEAQVSAPQAAAATAAPRPETRRFFDSLRVITPNE